MKRKLRVWHNGDDLYYDVIDQYDTVYIKCNGREEAEKYIKEYYDN